MGLFDALKKTAADAVKGAVQSTVSTAAGNVNHAVRSSAQSAVNSLGQAVKNAANKTERFSFPALPQSLEEMKTLPEAALTSPFQAAALTVCALCVFGEDKAAGSEMLNFLKGPQPLTPRELQFIADRFMDGRKYVPRSYFDGAAPDNDYTPAQPYAISISDNPYSYQEENYATLYIRSGGADSPRQVKLRRKGEQWFLWEQFLLTDVRTPKSADPWA